MGNDDNRRLIGKGCETGSADVASFYNLKHCQFSGRGKSSQKDVNVKDVRKCGSLQLIEIDHIFCVN